MFAYTGKKCYRFFRPQPGSLTKLSLVGKSLIMPGQGEFGQWHPGWGREKQKPFFYSVCIVLTSGGGQVLPRETIRLLCVRVQYNYSIYAPMIYTALFIMFWMRAYPLQGQVGGGWALKFKIFLGPVKWHRTHKRVPFGAQKTPTALVTSCIFALPSPLLYVFFPFALSKNNY